MPDTNLDSAYRVLLGRLRIRRSVEATAVAASAAAITALAGLPPGRSILIAAAVLPLAYVVLGRLPVYRRVSPAAFADHLDRRFPELEESTRLVQAAESELTPLQRLQRTRVAAALPSALARQQHWLPPAAHAKTLAVLVAAGLLALLAVPIKSAIKSTATAANPPAETAPKDLIASADVRIDPPAYTGLDAKHTDGLDLELPEGSTVTWQFRFRRPGEYALVIGDEQRVLLSPGPDGTLVGEARIEQTSLYRIVELVDGSERALDGVYTLSVSLDKPPRLVIVDPDASALAIERDESPRFDSKVVVRDDFGLGPVEIRASVAKGSGEGVKFRDEVFEFDAQSAHAADSGAGGEFVRSWNLEALDMEPGDEVYFFVVATDNRDPEPNVSRSDTVVVRWLDEAPEVVTGGDIAIDVMPEYYKSQRQIIIETEALIADRDLLDEDTFDTTSRELGEAQGELKNRYGQFLGDEFGESLDGDFGPADSARLPESEDPDDTHEGHAHGDADGHAHAGEPGAVQPGNREALVARFTHSHEVADIGPVAARNPVGLMKRSVASMWQSELHLRLSEPAKALPYQYEALDYYNRARAADRIFTRRLGFEPPPVSEDNRLTGDISDVQSSRLDEVGAGAESDRHLFRELHSRLSMHSRGLPFDPGELELLARAAGRLQQLSSSRPALIRQAATLERLRLAGGPAETNCEDCLADGIRAAWSALASAHARPVPGARPLATGDALIRDYAGLEPRVE